MSRYVVEIGLTWFIESWSDSLFCVAEIPKPHPGCRPADVPHSILARILMPYLGRRQGYNAFMPDISKGIRKNFGEETTTYRGIISAEQFDRDGSS